MTWLLATPETMLSLQDKIDKNFGGEGGIRTLDTV